MNTSIKIGWIKPPFETGGLDHLGAQAPCIQIYSQLLPGITNVTDRARYYSFYPWLFAEFDKRGWLNQKKIVTQLRKADCLFTLISIRHGIKAGDVGDHANSAVGSNTLTKIVTELLPGQEIFLTDFTHLEEPLKRYFKNPLGGFGQYYFGVLEGLRVMSGDSASNARLIREIGVPLANAMSSGVQGDLFLHLIEADLVTLKDLDDLDSFCHCQLSSSVQEKNLLTGLMRGGWPAIAEIKNEVLTEEERASIESRSKSLGLFIQLAGISEQQKINLDIVCFRGLTYTHCDHSGNSINIKDSLRGNADIWQVYQRNELLAVAMQGFFSAILQAAKNVSNLNGFMTTKEICSWFWKSHVCSRVIEDQSLSLRQFLIKRFKGLPDFSEWKSPSHEIQLSEKIVQLTHQTLTDDQIVDLVEACFKCLAAICYRDENTRIYEPVSFRQNYLSNYPINLESINSIINESLRDIKVVDALIRFTASYCLDSHLRVAMRKLRQQGQNTSRFELAENGIYIKEIPPATHTSPRFNQAMQILLDLGLLCVKDELHAPTNKGLDFLKDIT